MSSSATTRNWLSLSSQIKEVEALARGDYLFNVSHLLVEFLQKFRLPEQISTIECAEKYRKLPGNEGGAVVGYDRWRTPFNIGPMNSLDDPSCQLMVMVKPSRSGGTTVAENYLFKMAMFGPMGHISWVLNSDEAVTDYCRNVVKPMFELNADLQAKVDGGRGNDTDSFKRIRGYPVEWLSAKDSTFRNRQPLFMVSDETDAWAKRFARTPKVQIDGRQKLLGNRRKGAIMSHPDLGWASGVAAAYEDSSRGIFVMQCPECLGYASAFSTKFWPDVPQFRLHWTKTDSASKDDRIELAERTACMLCPHCGAALDDEQRRTMVDKASAGGGNTRDGWMHRGQTLDALEGVLGEMQDHATHGFWVHGLMLKTEALSRLARDYEAALIDFERTRDPDKLKEFMSKQLGEVFEGAATTGGVSANALKARVKESEDRRGIVPDWVKFVTASVDPGHRKFDAMWVGWGLDARSIILDRQTIRQRLHSDGVWRDIHVAQQIEDWNLLLPMVVDRKFPLTSDPSKALPVACTCIDSGDGNVTWKAREFFRRALRAGYTWGRGWSRIKLVKGFDGKRPMLPVAPTKVLKDELGHPVEPVTLEYALGVDALKTLTYERLAITDGSPGQVDFAQGIEPFYIDEFFGEALVDGKWKRSGPNETLDLYGYAEAARQMLSPDRSDIDWTGERRPPWAKVISLQPEGGDQAASVQAEKSKQQPKPGIFERYQSLNKG